MEIATQPHRRVTELPVKFWSYQIEAIANLTRRQVGYWVKTSLIKPAASKTPGRHNRFNREDLRKFLVMRALAEGGVSTHQLRTFIEPVMAALEADGWEPNYDLIAERCPSLGD